MPDRSVDLLFQYLRQNSEPLSGRLREREFRALRDAESERIERLYHKMFGDRDGTAARQP